LFINNGTGSESIPLYSLPSIPLSHLFVQWTLIIGHCANIILLQVLQQTSADVGIVLDFAVAFAMSSKQYIALRRYHCGRGIMKPSRNTQNIHL
jgi:hypothetical protein